MAAAFTVGWVKPKRDIRKILSHTDESEFTRTFPGGESDLIIIDTEFASSYGGWLIARLGPARNIFEAIASPPSSPDVESGTGSDDEGSACTSSEIDQYDHDAMRRYGAPHGRPHAFSCVRDLHKESEGESEEICSSGSDCGLSDTEAETDISPLDISNVAVSPKGGHRVSDGGSSTLSSQEEEGRGDGRGHVINPKRRRLSGFEGAVRPLSIRDSDKMATNRSGSPRLQAANADAPDPGART